MHQRPEYQEETASPEAAQTETQVSRRLPRWKLILVSLALLMGVAGMVFHPQPPLDSRKRGPWGISLPLEPIRYRLHTLFRLLRFSLRLQPRSRLLTRPLPLPLI